MRSTKFLTIQILSALFLFGPTACSDGNQGPATQITKPAKDKPTGTRTAPDLSNPEDPNADLVRNTDDFTDCIEEQNCIGDAIIKFSGKREDGVISNKGFTFLVMEPTILSRFRFKLDTDSLIAEAEDADLRMFMDENAKLTSSSVNFNKRTKTGTLTLSQDSKTRDGALFLVIRNIDVCKEIQSNSEIDGKDKHSCTTGDGKTFKSTFYDQRIQVRYVVDDLSVTEQEADKPGFWDHALSCGGGIVADSIGGVLGDLAGGVISGVGAAGGGSLDCSKKDDDK